MILLTSVLCVISATGIYMFFAPPTHVFHVYATFILASASRCTKQLEFTFLYKATKPSIYLPCFMLFVNNCLKQAVISN